MNLLLFLQWYSEGWTGWALPRGRGCGNEGWTRYPGGGVVGARDGRDGGRPGACGSEGWTDGRRPGAGLVSRDRVNASQIVINIVSQN